MKTKTKLSGIQQELRNWLDNKVEDDYTEKSILKDLQQNGCVSGMVSELIYYSDTVTFFNKHKKEIMQITEDWLNNTEEDLKSFLMHANNFPMDKKELQRESFINGLDGLLKNNKEYANQIKNWFAWFAFEETAYQYYNETFEQ